MIDNTNSEAHNTIGVIVALLIILGCICGIIKAAVTRGCM